MTTLRRTHSLSPQALPVLRHLLGGSLQGTWGGSTALLFAAAALTGCTTDFAELSSAVGGASFEAETAEGGGGSALAEQVLTQSLADSSAPVAAEGGAAANEVVPECIHAVGAGPGWTNPGLFYLGPEATAPTCDSKMASLALGGMDPEPGNFECSACACGEQKGGECSIETVTFFQKTTCIPSSSQPGQQVKATLVDHCEQLNLQAKLKKATADDGTIAIQPHVIKTGTCESLGGEPTVRETSWKKKALLCGDPVDSNGVDGASVCLPADPAFSPHACVAAQVEGDLVCPAQYDTKYLIYTEVDDQRQCTKCECGDATLEDSSCSATTYLYKDSACTDISERIEIPHVGNCGSVRPGLNYTHFKYVPTEPTGGTCEPLDVHSEYEAPKDGTVPLFPTHPLTICCTGPVPGIK